MYDLRGEYLTPPLQGYRLQDGEYLPLLAVTVLPGRGVAVHSAVFGLDLRDVREERMVRLHDPATGRDLLTYRESELARQAAEVRNTALEARTAELEARIRDLENT